MNTKFLHGTLLLSLMFMSVPCMFAEGEVADPVVPDEQAVQAAENFVVRQLKALWQQASTEHPYIASSLVMLVASALVYRSNTAIGKTMRSTGNRVCGMLSGLCPCAGAQQDDTRRAPRTKRDRRTRRRARVGCPVTCDA